MIAVFFAPIYIIVNIYLLYKIHGWMKTWHVLFEKKWVGVIIIAVYAFFVLSLPLAFFMPESSLQRWLKLVSNYWLGVFLYMGMAIAIAEIFKFILTRSKRIAGIIKKKRVLRVVGSCCLIIVALTAIYGVYNAGNIRTTPYEINVNKDGGNLDEVNIVLVSDLHLGYNIGCTQMTKMTKLINEQNPDLVIIAGDVFDNSYEALDDPDRLIEILQGIESKYGVYAVYGNHDIEEKIIAGFTFKSTEKKQSDLRMDALLEKADIKLLRDEAVMIDDSFYLYGRPDYTRPGRGIDKRKSPEEITENMDLSKPVIVIDHQPREFEALASAGVDIDLSGHTHAGQIFPSTIIMPFRWENPYGYEQIGNMHSFVSSGVGVFGPNMRVGSIAEICPIKVTFSGNKASST